MKIKIDGAVLHLGRLRKDGYRNVERARLTNWRLILPSLRRSKIRNRMVGKQLTVQVDDPSQQKLAFMDAG